MPNYTITLGSDTVAAIAADRDEARSLVARDLLDEESGLLGIMSHYCKDDRGEPAGGSLNIDPELMGIFEDFTGAVAVEFQEQAYYGCRDMDIQDDHEVEISFRISVQDRTLILDVPESLRESYWHSHEGGDA